MPRSAINVAKYLTIKIIYARGILILRFLLICSGETDKKIVLGLVYTFAINKRWTISNSHLADMENGLLCEYV